MAPDDRGRFLVAVGVDSYDSAQWEKLEHVPEELSSVMGYLTAPPFRITRILEDESLKPEGDEFLVALGEWATSAERSTDDLLILYWTGHGDAEDGRLNLILPATRDALADALPFERIVGVLVRNGSRIGAVLLLVDVCFAGHAALDIGARLGDFTRKKPRNSPPNIVALLATGSRGEAEQKAFSEALIQGIQKTIDPNERLRPGLDIVRIGEHVKDLLAGRGQVPGFWWTGSPTNFPFIPNPHHIAHWPDGIDEATQRLFAKLDPASRGVAHPEDTGWFFKGRQRALADICGWLNSEKAPGLCRVTGKVGAGKSAVLGRLYLSSRPDYREHLPSKPLGEHEMPGLGSIDAAVLLSGKTFPEIVAEIARGLRIVAETQDQLIAKLRRLDRFPVLLVDGLDEAIAPRRTRDLLAELAATTVRVIVGIRKPNTIGPERDQRTEDPRGEGQADLDIDLDRSPWFDEGAVESYILHRLGEENERLRALSPPWIDDLKSIAGAVAHRSDGNFLIARLTIMALIAGAPGDPRDLDWNFPENVGVSFDLIFATLGDDETRIGDLLVPLCYAQGDGLPRGPLWVSIASRLSHRAVTGNCLERLFEKAAYFILGNGRSPVASYGLFHAALKEHLERRAVPLEDAHHHISDELRICLTRSDASDDVGYARSNLTRHLRLAGGHRAIADLVVDTDWIARQSGGHALDPGYYARDIDEAWTAAHEANLRVTNGDGPAPALALTVWSLLWRSALVSQIRDLPPSAWALAVRVGAVSPARALRSAVSVGDADTRAIRLTVLARLFGGQALDELLDFALGTVPLPYGKTSPKEDAPDKYEYVLIAALSGPEAKRLVSRCLRDAPRIKEYGRWSLLNALLPHLEFQQLGQVRDLIGEVAKNIEWEHAGIFGAYVAEGVRRGDTAGLREAMSMPRDRLAWWAAAGALFNLRKEGIEFDESLSLFDEMKRAEREIEDWLLKLEVMTVLASAISDLELPRHREILAIYLRGLRDCDTRNTRVRSAAAVGACLPEPHGKRLLVWAKAHFDRPIPHDDLNMNWFHTPRRLAIAFAKSGELALALDVMKHTRDSTFLWPKAVIDVFDSFDPQWRDTDAAGAIARFVEARPRLELDIYSAAYDWLDDEQRNRVRELLSTHRLTMGAELVSMRCLMATALARHTPPADDEFRTFLELAEKLDPYERNLALQNMAEACARSGQIPRVSTLLEIVARDQRPRVWADVLGATAEPFLSELIESEANRFGESGAVDQARDGLKRAIETISSKAVKSLSNVPGSRVDAELLAALDVRAFELEGRGAERAPLRSKSPFLALMASRRLAPETRTRFIERLRKETGPWERGTLEDAFAFALTAGSTDFEFEVEVEPLVGVLASVRSLWILELIPERARNDVVDAFFDSRIRSEQVGNGFLDYHEWLLPALGLEQVMDLLKRGRAARDDYIRDETVVMLLPRIAELVGYRQAKELQKTVRRYDFRSESMVALWRFTPEEERRSVFSELIAERNSEPDAEASALRKIASLLEPEQLQQASEWVVDHFDGTRAFLLEPFISAACRLSIRDGYAVWDRALSAAARRPLSDAIPYLRELIPLAERLGGEDALRRIDRHLARAADSWP